MNGVVAIMKTFLRDEHLYNCVTSVYQGNLKHFSPAAEHFSQYKYYRENSKDDFQ